MGKSIFDLTEKTGYNSPWDENWAEVEIAQSGTPSVNFKGGAPDKIKINTKKLLVFKIGGTYSGWGGTTLHISLKNGNKELSFTTTKWSAERGWTIKTNVTGSKVGTYTVQFYVGANASTTISLTFYDPNDTGAVEKGVTKEKAITPLTEKTYSALNLTDKQKAQFKATVLSETAHGLTGLYEIAWVYFSRIKDMGWTKAMNGSAAFSQKNSNYRLWMYYLGEGDEYKDYNYQGNGKLSSYIKNNQWFTGRIEPRGKAYMEWLEKVPNPLSSSPKNKYGGWHGQGYWRDLNLNPSAGKGDQWYMAREYYLLQVEKKVSKQYVVLLEATNADGGKDETSFIFDVNAIQKFFKDNPSKLPDPDDVKKYTNGEGKSFKR